MSKFCLVNIAVTETVSCLQLGSSSEQEMETEALDSEVIIHSAVVFNFVKI